MPNAIGINILDTAQLDPGYVYDLVDRFDMAQVTVVEATHPDKAFALAKGIQRRRGDKTDIFYRRWRNTLPDERMVAQTTPEEFVRYMQDVMEAGFVASVYNEAQQIPMTPLTDYSVEVIERTALKGWRTVHFKTSTGTPRGYKGEQPDGYAESDRLWRLAVAVNKPLIDAGEKPLVHIAPHAYFATWGKADGHTDRPAEIIRRLKQLGLDPHYLPISIGETGLIEMASNGHVTDAQGGWRKIMNAPAAYARLYVDVTVREWLLMGAVGHLFSVGDQQTANGVPGQWYNFNLMGVTEFWDELERATAEGELHIVVKPTTKPATQFIPKPPDAKWPKEYVSRAARTMRSGPSNVYPVCTELAKNDVVTLYDFPGTAEVRADGLVYTWKWVESSKGNGWVTVTGWGLAALQPTVEVPVIKPEPEPEPPPTDPTRENPPSNGEVPNRPTPEIPTDPKPPEVVLTLTQAQLEALITKIVRQVLGEVLARQAVELKAG